MNRLPASGISPPDSPSLSSELNLDFTCVPGRNIVVFPTFVDSRVAAFWLGK